MSEIIKQEEMSNKVNDTIYETEREMTEEMLSEAIRKTRLEMGGIRLEDVAEIITENLDQSESRSLIDQLVIIHGKKWGERLFE